MSTGDANAKFPGQEGLTRNEAPSPSRENPAQVYPKTDPEPAAPESEPGTGGDHKPHNDPSGVSAEKGGLFKD